ncbi:hypothetical protein Ciccas_000916 [Cichlidogyrus casuarinus]|uniref:Protein kinase domain-containing protein n=1 Tax=Cichlidogyrus casuarinus TaxID=1844966 RepID=A0ABD2QLI8_9PLAT
MVLVAPRPLQGCYFFCEELAEGSFGTIYVAIHAITHQKVAVKILDKKKLGENTFRVGTEIEALKRLNHKYIYKLYQVTETESHFFLIFEYVPGGELFDYILQKERLPESEAKNIFRQLVSAIAYAHEKGFAHRDLKPENILLDNNQNIRVIDFGLCAKDCNRLLNTFCGSLAYAAPEVLANQDYVGPSADIWSMGVILYALLCGSLPFDPNKPNELPQKISKGQFMIPDYLSKESRHLLIKLLCCEPKKRIKMDSLRSHPWLLENNQPVAINNEPTPMSNLHREIVNELSAYTRIPRVEMVRMLKKQQYDYLMATYRIMETAYEEEGIFIRLHRREGANRALTTRRYAGQETCRDSSIPNLKPPLMPRSKSKYESQEVEETTLATPGKIKTQVGPDSHPSPSRRSVDSQIQQIADELNRSAVLANSSQRGTSMDNVKNQQLVDPEVNTPSAEFDKENAKPSFVSGGSHIDNSKSNLDVRAQLSKLKTIRPSNNVILCRQDLSPGQIFDRLSHSLQEQSIRFTLLKSTGFHCTIENDWGKVQLSFKLELVKVNISRKKNSHLDDPDSDQTRNETSTKPWLKLNVLTKKLKSENNKVQHVSATSPHDDAQVKSNSSQISSMVYSQTSMDDSDSDKSINKDFVVGIKTKRLHGDAMMFTSLCRSVVEMASIKQSK